MSGGFTGLFGVGCGGVRIHDPDKKRKTVDDHEAARKVRMIRGEVEGDKSAQAVTNNHGMHEMMLLNVAGEFLADVYQEGALSRAGGGSAKAGDRNHVTF